MDAATLKATARQIMDSHGLHQWRIATSRSVREAGSCRFLDQTLTFSTKIAAVVSREQTIDTILHEVAHALVGPSRDPHGPQWQIVAQSIGGTGEQHWNDPQAVESMARYIGTCPSGHKVYRNRRSDKMFRVSCGRCAPRYDAALNYTWTDATTGAPLN